MTIFSETAAKTKTHDAKNSVSEVAASENREDLSGPEKSGPQQTKSQDLATDLKSDTPGDPEKIRIYLEQVKSKFGVGSPLAPYAAEIARSEFWSLIIAICHPEQYNCTSAPYWNYWGMMKVGGGLRRFENGPEAIAYMDAYFHRIYPKRGTVQSLRGYYCASKCYNWEETVLSVKQKLEDL